MLPLSKTRIGLPSVKVSVMAGMRPLGLMARKEGAFWSFLAKLRASTLYLRLDGRVSHGSSRALCWASGAGLTLVLPVGC